MNRRTPTLALALLAAAAPAAGVEHVVTVSDYVFTPSVVQVAPGDTVRWTNNAGGHHHNVVADDGSFRCANGCDGQGGSGDPDDGAWSFTIHFPAAGDFPYFCEVHGGPGGIAMSGTVLVSGPPATCLADANTLCLQQNRFQIRANWQTGAGQSGPARVVKLTEDTGYLWFFTESNVEAVVKVLDGCGLNQRHLVFAGGLTDVRVELTVTDTATGIPKTYVNPQGTSFQPIQDTGAFASCP
jgi:plastocyanin